MAGGLGFEPRLAELESKVTEDFQPSPRSHLASVLLGLVMGANSTAIRGRAVPQPSEQRECLYHNDQCTPAPLQLRTPEESQSAKHKNRSFLLEDGQAAAFSIISAAFSPIMIDGALVLPDVSVGMIEASATRRPAMPWTRSWASTTAIGS